ncbi:DUF4276 family protein [Streptomyces corynorhini]|uniref:DUF4276 family protein n=1 Tax=Streptomyces corynorhini TaxID=2282652 RepID=UPI001314D17B|nr:DUF4276 family protein [Streptomyces corynorhini]
MSRYLTVGLLAEGPEDEIFLSAVAVRQLKELAARHPEPFDVGDTPLRGRCSTARTAHGPLCAEAVDLASDCDLLLIHNDHRERNKIEKICQDIALPSHCRIVGVVPVRETEAWLLADGPLLGSLPGAVSALIPSSPRDVERTADPKALLSRILPGGDTRELAEFLGERVDLDRLRNLPAYQLWCAELTAALKELRFL